MLYEKVIFRHWDGVYEPREDSFLLAKAVEEKAFGKVLDLGTGSGIQGIVAALKGGCDVTFSDINSKALECAMQNADLNKVKGRFINSSLFSHIKGKFNTIVFNPPYLPSEPLEGLKYRDHALDGGVKGREVIDAFLKSYKGFVEDEHIVLMVETSQNGYEKDVEKLKAKVLGKAHVTFEDIVVLAFK